MSENHTNDTTECQSSRPTDGDSRRAVVSAQEFCPTSDGHASTTQSPEAAKVQQECWDLIKVGDDILRGVEKRLDSRAAVSSQAQMSASSQAQRSSSVTAPSFLPTSDADGFAFRSHVGGEWHHIPFSEAGGDRHSSCGRITLGPHTLDLNHPSIAGSQAGRYQLASAASVDKANQTES